MYELCKIDYDAFQEALKSKGMRPIDLARAADVDPSTITRLKQRDKKIRFNTVEKMADVLESRAWVIPLNNQPSLGLDEKRQPKYKKGCIIPFKDACGEVKGLLNGVSKKIQEGIEALEKKYTNLEKKCEAYKRENEKLREQLQKPQAPATAPKKMTNEISVDPTMRKIKKDNGDIVIYLKGPNRERIYIRENRLRPDLGLIIGMTNRKVHSNFQSIQLSGLNPYELVGEFCSLKGEVLRVSGWNQTALSNRIAADPLWGSIQPYSNSQMNKIINDYERGSKKTYQRVKLEIAVGVLKTLI